MSKKRDRKRKQRKEQAPIRYLKNPFFTPWLNAALERIMLDATRPDTHRIWAWTARYAWGNWSAAAVKKGPRLPAAEDFDPAREIGVGYDPETFARLGIRATCPFCGNMRERGRLKGIPEDWPWHLHCMVIAYATDAVACGTPAEHYWAGSVAHDPAISAQFRSDDSEDKIQ